MTLIYWWTELIDSITPYVCVHLYGMNIVAHSLTCTIVYWILREIRRSVDDGNERKRHEQLEYVDVKFEYQTKFVLLPAFHCDGPSLYYYMHVITFIRSFVRWPLNWKFYTRFSYYYHEWQMTKSITNIHTHTHAHGENKCEAIWCAESERERERESREISIPRSKIIDFQSDPIVIKINPWAVNINRRR